MQRDSDLLIVISNDKLLELISEEVNMKRAFKLLDDVLLQTVKFLIDNIIMQNNDINSISKVLKQKFFVLNYNNCTLGVSVVCNSLNKMEDVENIHINFDEKDVKRNTNNFFMSKKLYLALHFIYGVVAFALVTLVMRLFIIP